MIQSDWRNRVRVLILVLAVAFASYLLFNVSSGVISAEAIPLLQESYKAASPEMVSPGDSTTYQIVLVNSSAVSNTGELTVTDSLDSRLSYVAGTSDVLPEGSGYIRPVQGNTLAFTINDIPASSVVTITFQVRLDSDLAADTEINNTAVIDDGVDLLQRSTMITVASPPISKIEEPWEHQRITQRGQLTIEGRAWFSDQDPEFPATPVLNPIQYVPGNDWYYVTWNDVPNAYTYHLEQDNTPAFSNPEILNDVTSPLEIKDMSRGTYYYRLKARNSYGDSFWSNVVSVTVRSSTLILGPVTPEVQAAETLTVEVNIKPLGGSDHWVRVTDVTADIYGSWWNWSYTWDLPVVDETTTYVIETRAIDAGNNVGEINSVTVVVANQDRFIYLPLIIKYYPPVPTSAPSLTVSDDDGYGNYTLSWTYPNSPIMPTSYTLQEATEPTFANPTLNEQATSPREFSDKDVGTYYYRVRGVNSYGSGPWSSVVSVSVVEPPPQGFFDDFSNTSSGWTRNSFKDGDRLVFGTWYESQTYRLKIFLDKNGLNNYRMGVIPAPYVPQDSYYTVEVDHSFRRADDQVVDPTSGKAGLVFRALRANDGYFKEIYVVEWNFEGQCAVYKYSDLPNYIPVVTQDRINWTPLRNWGDCPGLSSGYDKNVHAKVVVDGNNATVYLNGNNIGSFSNLGSTHYVGLTTGSWERTPVESLFDNFRVTE